MDHGPQFARGPHLGRTLDTPGLNLHILHKVYTTLSKDILILKNGVES